MPVYKVVQMPYDEFLGWISYFEHRPIGWRDDLRTMKILQSNGVKAKPEALFESIARIKQAEDARTNQFTKKGQVSSSNLMRSALFSKMLAAKGGDKLEVFDDKSKG